MRIGLLADIHGNLVALETVLAALARDHIDQIVCLGDVAALGPQPREVVAVLRGLGSPCVLGNTDAWLLDGVPAETSPAVTTLTNWAREQLAPPDLDYLRTFAPTITVPLAGEWSLFCFHGSPHSYEEVIGAATPDSELVALANGNPNAVLVGGHTHVPLIHRFGQSWLVNPGSVGLPGVGPGTPGLLANREVRWAEYAIVDADDADDSTVAITLRRVSLDLPRVLHAAAESGMPCLNWWNGRWAGDAV